MSAHLIRTLVAALALFPAAAIAIDPGVAKGTLQVEGDAVTLSHSLALRQDNTEGLLDGPELRLLLSDREVPPSALAGPQLTGIERLARSGGVRGILLRLEADARPDSVFGTLLYPPTELGASLTYFTLSGEGAGFQRFETGDKRILGEAAHRSHPEADFPGMVRFEYQAGFSAPVFQDLDVTADLKGRAAQDSEPARAFLVFEQALRDADLAAAFARMTEARAEELRNFLEQIGESEFRAQAVAMLPPNEVRKGQIERVVIRGKRATLIYREPGALGAGTLVEKDGAWKVD